MGGRCEHSFSLVQRRFRLLTAQGCSGLVLAYRPETVLALTPTVAISQVALVHAGRLPQGPQPHSNSLPVVLPGRNHPADDGRRLHGDQVFRANAAAVDEHGEEMAVGDSALDHSARDVGQPRRSRDGEHPRRCGAGSALAPDHTGWSVPTPFTQDRDSVSHGDHTVPSQTEVQALCRSRDLGQAHPIPHEDRCLDVWPGSVPTWRGGGGRQNLRPPRKADERPRKSVAESLRRGSLDPPANGTRPVLHLTLCALRTATSAGGGGSRQFSGPPSP